MTLNAITKDSTGRVVEWGAAALRSAGAGETAHGAIDEATQTVIDANGPRYTKVVINDFTVMTAPEMAAVDAEEDPIAAAAAYADFLARLDTGMTHDYGDVSGPIEIDWRKGLQQMLTLTGDLETDDITFVYPTHVRKLSLMIVMGGAGGYDIPADAWPSDCNWGSRSAPDVTAVVVGKGIYTYHQFDGGSELCCFHDDTNEF